MIFTIVGCNGNCHDVITYMCEHHVYMNYLMQIVYNCSNTIEAIAYYIQHVSLDIAQGQEEGYRG